MAEGALEKLRESQPGGKEAEALLCDTRVKRAQEIAGLAGWIATSCRPDAYFAYVVLSQYLAFGLTRTVWRALLRWAAYLRLRWRSPRFLRRRLRYRLLPRAS